jgi:hypothetical protein
MSLFDLDLSAGRPRERESMSAPSGPKKLDWEGSKKLKKRERRKEVVKKKNQDKLIKETEPDKSRLGLPNAFLFVPLVEGFVGLWVHLEFGGSQGSAGAYSYFVSMYVACR